MKHNILLLAPYCSLPGEQKFNRFLYLAELLSVQYNVTLVTSSFRHYDKQQRIDEFPKQKFDIVKIYEPGYVDNVSLKRVYSHRVFLKNFIDWFNGNSGGFDLVYSAYPLIGTNVFLAKNKTKLNYKLVIDIQDVWPEAIASAFPFIASIPKAFLPFTKKANYCYKNADGLVAVSKTYLDRALSVSNPQASEVVYIGSDSFKIDEAPKKELKGNNIKLIYIGSLGYSYDVKTVLCAVNKLVEQGYGVEFHIVGGGKQEPALKAIAGDNIYFHGFVTFNEMVSLVKACELGVNALVGSAPQSITNKLSDYFSIGVPMLNSQKTPELLTLLEHHPHVNYEAGDIKSCELAIKKFIETEALQTFTPNKLFYRKNSYPKIINIVESLCLKD